MCAESAAGVVGEVVQLDSSDDAPMAPMRTKSGVIRMALFLIVIFESYTAGASDVT